MERKITNLELSKKLKELGVKQESEFYWIFDEEENEYVLCKDEYYSKNYKCVNSGEEYYFRDVNEKYSAYLSCELGEMLPIHESDKGFDSRYKYRVFCNNEATYSDIEANARAKMLIYLLENNLIEL